MNLEEKILALLDEKKIAYEVFEHEPVYTNPAMAEALKVKESETVKSLVLNTKEGRMIVLVLPGDKKVNWKQVEELRSMNIWKPILKTYMRQEIVRSFMSPLGNVDQ